MIVSKATLEDISKLVMLINSAYRGEDAKKGWTNEAELLSGNKRTDEAMLTEILQKKSSTILKVTTNNKTVGSVYLDIQERGLYLGMLTVSPILQGGGIGKLLMAASESFAKENNCSCIFMNVISVRNELINWYEKIGYYKTGETKPFPDDNLFGIPTQPLEFAILEKMINK